jgi:hypothetical protein
MRRVMDWLDLERNPVIVIGKEKALALS